MFTKDDLIDAIVRHLQSAQAPVRPAAPAPAAVPSVPAPSAASPNKRSPASPPPGPQGKLFLSEYDILRRLTAGQTRLTIPRDAIISPLAVDGLVLRGITVVRE